MNISKTQFVEILGLEPKDIDWVSNNFGELLDKGGTPEKRVRWAEDLRDKGVSHITPGQVERWVVTAEFLKLYLDLTTIHGRGRVPNEPLSLQKTDDSIGDAIKRFLHSLMNSFRNTVREKSPVRNQNISTIDADANEFANLLTALDIDGVKGFARLGESNNFVKRVNQYSKENPIWQEAGQKLIANLPDIKKWAKSLADDDLIETHSHNLLLMSDMHICSGIDQRAGKLSPNEDFLYDEAFAAFLAYHQDQREGVRGMGTRKDRPWRLIMNGDVVDFLQIHEVPPRNLDELLDNVNSEIGELRDFLDQVIVDPKLPLAHETRRILKELRQELDQLSIDASPLLESRLRQLITETDILLARGDNAVNLDKLDKLETLVFWKTMELPLQDIDWARETPDAEGIFEHMENTYAQSDTRYQFQQSVEPELDNLKNELGPEFDAWDDFDDWINKFEDSPESAFDRYLSIWGEFNKNKDQYTEKDCQRICDLRDSIARWEYDEPDGDPHYLGYDNLRWGLSSNDVDNAWRVQLIYAGHPTLFMAIAWFLAYDGNQVIIQTGNHDIELRWPEVHQAFRDAFANAFVQLRTPLLQDEWATLFSTFELNHVNANGPEDMNGEINSILYENLVFSPWLYYEPGVVYAEHGCQYEPGNSWFNYLYPQIVGFRSGSIKKQRDAPNDESGHPNLRHPKLFWPWGSLIVRFIFNRIEEIHPFADQVKPITRYFTWLLSKNFLLSLWILILTIPGMLKIAGQFFVRGVVEGWFGSLRTFGGILNILGRGISAWLTWMSRFFSRNWISRQDSTKHPLSWPVLGWLRWWQIGDENGRKLFALGNHLPYAAKTPQDLEMAVLASDDFWYFDEDDVWEDYPNDVRVKEDSPRKFSQWCGRYTAFITEAALQIGLLLLFIGLASLITGWNPRMSTSPVNANALEAVLYQTRDVCMPFDRLSISEGLFGSFFSFPWLLLIVLGLVVFPVTLRGLISWKRDNEQSTRFRIFTFLLALLPLTLFIVIVFLRLRCNLSFTAIKGPATPWAGSKDQAQWLFWLISLVIVINFPVGDYWKRSYWGNGHNEKLLVKVILTFLALGFASCVFIWFYTRESTETISSWVPWMMWLGLIGLTLLIKIWWGNTAMLIGFVITTLVGLLAGVGKLLIAFGDHTSGLFKERASGPFWLLLLLLVGGIFLYWLVFVYKLPWKKIPALKKQRNAYTDLGQVVLIGAIFIVSFCLLPYLQDGFLSFCDKSNWNWLPIWAIWGALGIWLLEPRDRDQPGKFQDSWIGKDHINRWTWISDVLDGTFTMSLELSVLIFLLGLLAQINPLFLGRPTPRVLVGFSGNRIGIFQLVLFAALLLGIGSLGRSLLNLIRTDDITEAFNQLIRKPIFLKMVIGVFAVPIILIVLTLVSNLNNVPWIMILSKVLLLMLLLSIGARGLIELARNHTATDIVCRWRRRYGWLLDLCLGIGLLGLLFGSFFMIVGSGLLRSPFNWISIGLLALVGAFGWSYTHRLLDSNNVEKPTAPLIFTSALIAGIFVMILSIVMILLYQNNLEPDQLMLTMIKGVWTISTALIILGLVGTSFTGNPMQANHQRLVQVLNAVSWGVVLLAGILLSVNITVLVLGYRFQGSPNIPGQSLPTLVWNPEDDEMITLEEVINEAMFQLRLRQAVDLSYTGYEPDDQAYIERLEIEDKAMSNYFQAIIDQPDTVELFRSEIRSLTGGEYHALASKPEGLAEAKDGLYPVQMSAKAVQLAEELNPATGKYQPANDDQARLADIAVELQTLACQQAALTGLAADYPSGQARDQVEWCELLSDKDLPKDLDNRRNSLNQAWMDRLHPTADDPQAVLTQRIATSDNIDFNVSDIPWDQFGLWEKTYIVIWSGLRNVDLSTLVVVEPDAAKVSTDPLQILQLRIDHRQERLKAFQLLQRTLRQHQVADTLYWLAGIFFAALVLVGLSGYLVVNLLTSSKVIGQTLTAAEQVKQIDELGKRHRSGFIRKVLRFGAVLLSFLFGAGLVVGAYIIATGFFRGDFITALRNGSILSILSLIGRRLVSLIPQGDSHGGGYLFDASVEIRQILNRGKKDGNSLCWVPYIYLGHDHHAAYLRFNPEFSNEKWLPEKEIAPQWYVNTGSWVEAKSGEVRYRREDEAYAVYGLIVPGPDTTGAGASPTLLRWDITARRPARLDNLVTRPREAAPKRVIKVILGWLGLRQDYLDPPTQSTLE